MALIWACTSSSDFVRSIDQEAVKRSGRRIGVDVVATLGHGMALRGDGDRIAGIAQLGDAPRERTGVDVEVEQCFAGRGVALCLEVVEDLLGTRGQVTGHGGFLQSLRGPRRMRSARRTAR